MICYDMITVSRFFLSPYVRLKNEVDSVVISQELFGTMMKIYGDTKNLEKLLFMLRQGLSRKELQNELKLLCINDTCEAESIIQEAIAKGIIE